MPAMQQTMQYHNRRVTVMGLGRFGGGAGVVRFLCDRGARVTVTDLSSEDELADSLRELDACRIHALHLGEHRAADFERAELIVVNPAVNRRSSQFVQLATAAGVPLTSEIELFVQHHRGRTVAVTGSNGKSTTAALTHAILSAAGVTSRLGGNIGRSLLPVVETIVPDNWTVLELSSFQLEPLSGLGRWPDVAVVTNFSPNHLDRHGTLEAYRAAKQNLLANQTAEQTAILNAGDADVSQWPARGRSLWFGDNDHGREGCRIVDGRVVFRDETSETTLPLSDWLTLPGKHNRQNAMAAACAALAAGVPVQAIEQGLRSFQPLPHRLQFVAEAHGRRFYNDSIATTPESVSAALASFSEPVVLLAGGSDKGIDLTDLAHNVAKQTVAVALLGETAATLERLIATTGSPRPACRTFADLPRAFHWAVEQSQPGHVVLLSPGCASYDWFRDFRNRGEAFTQLVKTWAQRPASAA